MKVAVVGASGAVGRLLIPELVPSHDVVGISRREPRRTQGAEWYVADAADSDRLTLALEGVSVVFHLVHSLGAPGFEERDRVTAAAVASACERAGVRQIVFLGGLGEERPELSPHLRSRAETSRILASGSVPVTTIRSAIVIAPGSAAFETVVSLVDRLPAMICPRWVNTLTQPIAAADIVRYLAGVAGRRDAFGQTYDAAGPEVMSYRGMIERVAVLLGRRPLIIEVPVLTPALSALWLHLVTPVRASVARPLVEGLRNETVARDHRLRELVPIEQTPFSEAARVALRGRTSA
ncbi:MAG: NAD(P)H-binding protein [Gaiellales bacterium]